MLCDDRFTEAGSHNLIAGGGGEPHSIKSLCVEFSSVAALLKPFEGSIADVMDESVDELWERRRRLVHEIVEASAATIEDAIFKVTIMSSFLADGELRLGLTNQCVEDCDRALAVEDQSERCLKALEPALWIACQRVRDRMAEAVIDEESLAESWWREFGDAVRAIARYRATTPVGLRAKGEIFRDLFRFGSAMDGLILLQMSYMRDFGVLAVSRLHGEPWPTAAHATAVA
jgi:hypothetical protein